MSFYVYGSSESDQIKIEFSTFPGGEEYVRIIDAGRIVKGLAVVNVKARLRSSADVMKLIMLTDALKRNIEPTFMRLHLGYVPYARQDRVCNVGESHSARVMCDLINSLKYNQVVIKDPHSDVIPALLDNVLVLDQVYNITHLSALYQMISQERPILISPDAGALKKVYAVAEYFDGLDVVRADKTRDTKTTKITGTEVYCDNLYGRDVLIVDDICDGGYTFIKLAEALRANEAGKISLYVTHGIFSKGIEALTGIDVIYTTDSFSRFQTGKYGSINLYTQGTM